jgi:MFS family permease
LPAGAISCSHIAGRAIVSLSFLLHQSAEEGPVSVGLEVYVPLSVVMFLEYAVWGAWSPVLAARLLGPLKMTGKQTGWIYATLPLACIISPLIAGQLADSWFATKWILGVAHLVGAVFLLFAAGQRRFGPLFAVMLCYSMFFAATMPLVNSILFAQVKDVATQSNVFIWAPVAWALVGYSLTGWRWVFKTEGEGRDCLVLAAILSIAMGLCCLLLLPTNELAKTGEMPIVKAFATLKDGNFLLFMVISLVVAGLMQFYFLGTAQFMQDMGIAGRNVPAAMAIAQAFQAGATFFLLGRLLDPNQIGLGFKWTLTLGAGCWLLMYLIYIATKPRWLIVFSQSLHGLAYVFFMIVGQIFAESVAGPEIRSSMQALVFAATVGVGLFFGTQFAGIVMDRCSMGGRFQWRSIWLVPGAIVLIGVLALATGFRDPPAADEKGTEKTADKASGAAALSWQRPLAATLTSGRE